MSRKVRCHKCGRIRGWGKSCVDCPVAKAQREAMAENDAFVARLNERLKKEAEANHAR